MLLLACSTAFAADQDKIEIGKFIAADPPQPAPAAAFTDLEGKPASLADLKGKPAIVNLWATWCEPCLKEMPSLDRLQGELAGKLTVIAVSEDRGGAELVKPFAEKLGLQHVKIYLDPKSDLGHALKVRGLPTSIVLDGNGNIVGHVEGAADWDSDNMKAVLQPFLSAEAKHAAR